MASEKPKKDKIKNYLKNHGHNAASVDAKNWNANNEVYICELHGVTEAEYQAGKH